MERLHWPQPRTKWRQYDPLNQQLKTQQAARQAEAAQGPQNIPFAGVIDTLLQSHSSCVCAGACGRQHLSQLGSSP